MIIPNSVLISGSTPSTLSSGLVAYFPFTGNAGDSSGKGNHGVATGISLTTDRFSKKESAYQFPGDSAAFINIPIKNGIGISSEISLCAWIYMEGGTINPRIISAMNGPCEGYWLGTDGTSNTSRRLDACFYGGVACSEGSSISVLNVEALKWNFIVYTLDAFGKSNLYLNGVLVGSKSGYKVTNGNYTSSITIGRKAGYAFDAWGGKIDDVRIYNRALTQEEITLLANN
jgi:hypothetical protein